MSLHNAPDSILTHGGKSKDALVSALRTVADHHADQHEALFAGSPGAAHTLRHLHWEDPDWKDSEGKDVQPVVATSDSFMNGAK